MRARKTAAADTVIGAQGRFHALGFPCLHVAGTSWVMITAQPGNSSRALPARAASRRPDRWWARSSSSRTAAREPVPARRCRARGPRRYLLGPPGVPCSVCSGSSQCPGSFGSARDGQIPRLDLQPRLSQGSTSRDVPVHRLIPRKGRPHRGHGSLTRRPRSRVLDASPITETFAMAVRRARGARAIGRRLFRCFPEPAARAPNAPPCGRPRDRRAA